MKQLWSQLKPYLRWFILGGTLFFLIKTLKDNWQEVAAIRIDSSGWGCLAIALILTLLAHTWAGFVWNLTLREFNQPVLALQVVRTYLITNIAKYLPGNVWHYYGRVLAATKEGVPAGIATLSVLLEPLLMAAAALLFTLLGSFYLGSETTVVSITQYLLSLGVVLLSIHPRTLNPIIQRLAKAKQKGNNTALVNMVPFKLQRYPLIPLLGEMGFVGLRGGGFIFTFLALNPVGLDQIPLLISAFSLAWLLGLIIPGAPGGIGIFEATAIELLNPPFPQGLVLGVVALYRLNSVLAETISAGLAWLHERRYPQEKPSPPHPYSEGTSSKSSDSSTIE